MADQVHIKHANILKLVAELQSGIISGGAIFLIIEGRTIKWKIASKNFDMEIFSVGSVLKETSMAARAMNENKALVEKVPRALYGVRLITVAIPLVDDAGRAVGAFSIVMPRLHPIARSFPDFAPMIVELFPEGAFLYISDLTKIILIQPSHKFTLPNMHVGYELKEADIAYKTIHAGKAHTAAVGAERYGVPVYVENFPLYDDTGKEIVGTLGVVIPKKVAETLSGMSGNLANSITDISATIEHIANNATNINQNEHDLYQYVKAVTNMVDKINDVSGFISSVANQSKMLGLNAAIEASRAGEAGRGFSVVAGEIQKLANQSNETVVQIKSLIQNIKNNVNEVDKRSSISLQASEEQASATQEISASIEELSAMAEELNILAKEL